MPDDRELTDTRAAGQAAERPGARPGRRRRADGRRARARPCDTDDILVKKPLGLLFWLAIGWVGLVVVLAILANLLPLPNPDFQNYSAINASPSVHHLLGTDDLGRDLLSRLIFGARVSLVVGFGSVVIGMLHRRAPWVSSRATREGGWTSRSTPARSCCWPFRPSWPSSPSWPSGVRPCGRSPSSSGWPPSPCSTGWCAPPACPSPTATS